MVFVVAISTYAVCCTILRLAPLLVTGSSFSSSEDSCRTRFLVAAALVFGTFCVTLCLRTVSSSSMTSEVSGVERVEALALNTGDTVVVGVADDECPALERPRVTGMASPSGHGRVRGGRHGVTVVCDGFVFLFAFPIRIWIADVDLATDGALPEDHGVLNRQ